MQFFTDNHYRGVFLSHIKNLICRQGDFELNIPSLKWPDGEIRVLTGPSGSGKSTLALCLCGLKPVEKGFQWIHKGRDLAVLPPPARNISLLFQSLVLFPHLSAQQNILFPAKARGMKKAVQQERLAFFQKELELTGFLKKPVHLLSGGEKQRVALARALMPLSEFLILDEPFSSLNLALKKKAIALLKTMQAEENHSVLLISHSAEEIKLLAKPGFSIQKGRLFIGQLQRL